MTHSSGFFCASALTTPLLRCCRMAALRRAGCLNANTGLEHPLQPDLSMILTTDRLAVNATYRHPECLGCHEVLHMSHGDNIAGNKRDVC